VILLFLLPVWIVEAMAVGLVRIGPDGSPAGTEKIGFALSFLLLPSLAGVIAAFRGGSHFARAAAGASICGAGLIALAYYERDFNGYRFVVGKIALLTMAAQGAAGFTAGLLARLAANRLEWSVGTRGRIGALEGTGTGLLLTGAWACFVSLKWLGLAELVVGIAVFASGLVAIAWDVVLRQRLDAASAMPAPRWGAVIAGAIAVLAAWPLFDEVVVRASKARVDARETRIRQNERAFCANFTVTEWRLDPGAELVGKPELFVKVRAKSDGSLQLRHVLLFDAAERRLAAGVKTPPVDVRAGRISTLSARLERAPGASLKDAVLTHWALCNGPEEDTSSCAWWGAGRTSLLRDAPGYCPTPQAVK
jgi:hypothetical protein